MKNGILCGAITAGVLGSVAAADIITVGPGSKFDYPTITQAIKASSHFDEILVASGTYFERVNPRGKRITIRSTSGADQTIIDGGGIRRCVECTKGETKDTVIDGFTLQNGRSSLHSPGGGMYVHGASPTVQNCLFFGNETGSKGDYYSENGAGVAVSIGFPHFANCLFLGNTTVGMGGGMYCENSSEVTLTSCHFEANEAKKGGGIYLSDGSTALMSKCELRSNVADWYGGALYLLDECEATLVDCQIILNTSNIGGGGIYGQCGSIAVTGGSFELNTSASGGGMNLNCGIAVLSDVQFADNTASSGGDLRIAFGGVPLSAALADVSIMNSFFCGSAEPIEGPWTDLGGNTFFGSCSDGACCSNGICAITDADTCLLLGGDFAGLGVFCVDANCPGDCPVDITDDGFVGTNDLLSVISEWGPCP
ncbi:MAG: right-handed parallel beta-helix repeat-containing protein [Phycisphaerales bacterium]|nr:right-handed parallel beta-helix repeat-containing protein [Phycisphaerales bacterium]